MEVVTFCRARSFVGRAGPMLLEAESANNLPLGVTLAVAAQRPTGGGLFATVESGGAVVGAAVCTPPHKVLVTRMGEPAIDALVAHVARRGYSFAGVHGETRTATAFAEAYGRATERRWREHHAERIYEVSVVDEGSWP